jgi:acyl carrier protein
MSGETEMPGLKESRCPACGNAALPEFSQPAGLALCPRCGILVRRSRGALVPVGVSTESISKLVQSRMRGDDILRERVEARIREVVAERLGIDKAEVQPKAHLINDLGADSLDVAELLMAVEEEYGVNIDVD